MQPTVSAEAWGPRPKGEARQEEEEWLQHESSPAARATPPRAGAARGAMGKATPEESWLKLEQARQQEKGKQRAHAQAAERPVPGEWEVGKGPRGPAGHFRRRVDTQRRRWRLRAAGRAPQRQAVEPRTVKSRGSGGSTDDKTPDYCNKPGSDTVRKEML